MLPSRHVPLTMTLFVVSFSAAASADEADFKVDRGQLTFDAEGQESGAFHSRKAHVPSDSSGVTIGRGYDMREKKADKIEADLKKAGVSDDQAKLFAQAAGKKGDEARKFIKDTPGLKEITPAQQKKLFELSYAELEADVKRICGKDDVVKKYGETDWDKLHPAIRDVLVDLRFRGDYTPTAREKIQALVAKNDLKGFAAALKVRGDWDGVPKDRFDRRTSLLDAAVKAK